VYDGRVAGVVGAGLLLLNGPVMMTEPEQGDSRRGAMVGLIIAAVLLAFGLWLARDLSAASKMQDCLMSGRTNCNVIEPAR
jgi:hypothetical protein